MNNFIKKTQRGLLTGFIAFSSTFFISAETLESNSQNCGMIYNGMKKKRDGQSTETADYRKNEI